MLLLDFTLQCSEVHWFIFFVFFFFFRAFKILRLVKVIVAWFWDNLRFSMLRHYFSEEINHWVLPGDWVGLLLFRSGKAMFFSDFLCFTCHLFLLLAAICLIYLKFTLKLFKLRHKQNVYLHSIIWGPKVRHWSVVVLLEVDGGRAVDVSV